MLNYIVGFILILLSIIGFILVYKDKSVDNSMANDILAYYFKRKRKDEFSSCIIMMIGGIFILFI